MKSIQIQLTTKCNQKCIMCRKYTWPTKNLALEKVIEILENNKGATVTFSGGDPLEYSRLRELTEFLKHKQIIYQVLTNLTYEMTSDMFDFLFYATRIQISLDGYDAFTYNSIRHTKAGSFNNIAINCSLLRHSKKVFNCTLSKVNFEHLVDIYWYAKSLGLPLRVFPVHTHEKLGLSYEQIESVKSDFVEVDGIDVSAFSRPTPPPFCMVKQYHRVYDEQGREFPCCRAINDNGKDLDGLNQCSTLAGLNNPYVLYDFCKGCDRYVKFNNEWQKYLVDTETVFL